MECISKLLSPRDYTCFDENNQLQTRTLNSLQRLCRRIFGCYAETHLSNVAKRAYTVTLNGDFQRDSQNLLKILAKANEVYLKRTEDVYYAELPSYQRNSGEKVRVHIGYIIPKPKQVNEKYRIQSICFALSSDPQGLPGLMEVRSKRSGPSRRTEVILPIAYIAHFSPRIYEGLDAAAMSPIAEAAHSLLSKMLYNSESSEMKEIFTILHDLPEEFEPTGMIQHGWASADNPKDRKFSLTKAWAKQRGPQDYGQKLSLDFALTLLAETEEKRE